ncbi:MAG: glutathione S-transferase N-terminal domain-containing protein [Leptospirales bacterium]|nr:glutathione S-transferase N-terminal domain-containing protein [Leptospirales bacterium]
MRIYQFASCPYCQRVRQACDRLGMQKGRDYELVEASRGTPGRDEVIQLGGMSQVPFLTDGDLRMYESDDIVSYLQTRFAAGAPQA